MEIKREKVVRAARASETVSALRPASRVGRTPRQHGCLDEGLLAGTAVIASVSSSAYFRFPGVFHLAALPGRNSRASIFLALAALSGAVRHSPDDSRIH